MVKGEDFECSHPCRKVNVKYAEYKCILIYNIPSSYHTVPNEYANFLFIRRERGASIAAQAVGVPLVMLASHIGVPV